MFVEATVLPHLVDHGDHRAIVQRFGAGFDEDIDVIFVLADGPLDVAIVALHRHRPGLAALVLALAFGAGRILDAEIETTKPVVPQLVVSSLLLSDAGLGKGVFRRRCRSMRGIVERSPVLSRLFHGLFADGVGDIGKIAPVGQRRRDPGDFRFIVGRQGGGAVL